MCVADYFLVVTMLLAINQTVGKPVYFTLNGPIFVRKMYLWVEQQSLVTSQNFSANHKQLILLLTLAWCSLLDWMPEVDSDCKLITYSPHVADTSTIGPNSKGQTWQPSQTRDWLFPIGPQDCRRLPTVPSAARVRKLSSCVVVFLGCPHGPSLTSNVETWPSIWRWS